MKYLALAFALVVLNSCNTCIGITRDTKQAFHWTKSKFQSAGSGGGSHEEYGAPVY